VKPLRDEAVACLLYFGFVDPATRHVSLMYHITYYVFICFFEARQAVIDVSFSMG
jgi:hypothetical protein